MFHPDFALDNLTIAIVEDVFKARSPRVVLDLGSGRSTIALARLAKTTGARVVALEESEEYAAVTRSELQREGLVAEVVHAPIVNGWYAVDAIPKVVDLLVVDGPRDAHGTMRSPTVAHMADRMSPWGAIVVDDLRRDGEQAMVREWVRLGWIPCEFVTERGCSVLVRG